MQPLTSDIILRALSHVVDHATGRDVVSERLISGITVSGGKVSFVITLPLDEATKKAYLRETCEAAVQAIAGVEQVTAVLTAQSPPREASAHGQPQRPAVWNRTSVPGVKRLIAVASGKGGVGKSTTTVCLAQALARQGVSVGVLDADIYGPSVPRMLGLEGAGKPHIAHEKMLPHMAHGVQCMSVGFITGPQAAVLRGPMISKTLTQLLRATHWGISGRPLDVLLVDMPPGTGDVHLSLAQAAPVHGAIIVTTPQAVAVEDARKCLEMFLKLDVPILGVVENMSGDVFGQGGGKALAEAYGVPLLGGVALDAGVRQAMDAGQPFAHGAFSEIAAQLRVDGADS